MNERSRWTPLFLLGAFALLVMFMAQQLMAAGGSPVSWDELKRVVAEGEVEEVMLTDREVQVVKKAPEGRMPEVVTAVRVDGDDTLLKTLDERHIKYRAVQPSDCSGGQLSLLIFPLTMLAFFWFFLANRGGGGQGVAAFGRSNAKLVPEEGTGVTFADVAGAEEAADELREVVQFLKTPERFTRLGGRPPKGVLLVGPPGTGKTLLARAVAGEAGVPFLSISGSDFVEMFVGVGAARVRDLFKQAKEHEPCIIFIDELDAVGKSRGAGGPAGNEEREQTLNQMLVEMDGFDNRGGIIVMAATNRPEILDPALLRPGRFDRQVMVDRPDRDGRRAILQVHARDLKLDPNIDLDEVAKITPGFAGADLANVLNEAALLAARRDADAIGMEDVKEAIERVIAGLEKKNRKQHEEDLKITAYHEIGHALAGAASPGADPVHKITIVPRGFALGLTWYAPDDDRQKSSKGDLLNRLTSLYGGRAAEELIFGDVTTGASSDIQRATSIARDMVVKYGMSRELGPVSYIDGGGGNRFGIGGIEALWGAPATLERIDAEVKALTDRAYQQALDILTENRVLLHEMAQLLLEQEVLEGEQLKALLDRVVPADSMADPPTAEWMRGASTPAAVPSAELGPIDAPTLSRTEEPDADEPSPELG